MNQCLNDMQQPVGAPVKSWVAPSAPPHKNMHGSYCRLEPMRVEKHGEDLYTAFVRDTSNRNWTYLPIGPFGDYADFQTWLNSMEPSKDPLFFSIIDLKTEKAVGVASYLRIDPAFGVIEVGHIHFSPLLQRTTLSTEAMFLMMKNVFDLGYRRYEWKCDSLNEPSRKAALRFGFTFEGIFRQAIMYKGRNRDTAWFAIIDKDWPEIRRRYESWLQPDNFDSDGNQKISLRELMQKT